jgi:hypothetical protein
MRAGSSRPCRPCRITAGTVHRPVVCSPRPRSTRLLRDVQEAIDLLVYESHLQEVPSHPGDEEIPPMRYTITARGTAFLGAELEGL